MASEIRRSGRALEEVLQASATEFDFFQTVRLIHNQTIQNAVENGIGLRVPVGGAAHPMLECLRFRAHVAITFPSSEIASVVIRGNDGSAYPKKYEVLTTFMGLVGAQGVLPLHYTQLILRRRREQDESLRHFLDLFHHRLISIYYRAWQRSRFPFQWEEYRLQQGAAKEDRFTQSVYSFAGFGNAALQDTGTKSSTTRNRLAFSDQVLLLYAGLFSHRPRNAVSLQRLLSSLFRIPITILERQGTWIHLAPEDQTRMPGPACSVSRSNCRLGESAMAGERVRGVESRIRIIAGPVGMKDFRRFCPGQSAFIMLSQVVRLWVGPDFDVDLQVVLRQSEVPRTSLGQDSGTRLLGWTTWTGSRAASRDSKDAVFRLQGEPEAGEQIAPDNRAAYSMVGAPDVD
jgi:type VI secretion system protein ImpH